MQLSKTELKFLSETGKGNRNVSDVAEALKISISQLYRISQKLSYKCIINLKDRVIQPEMKTHVTMMINLLSKAVNLSEPFSGTGLDIYTALLEPKTIAQAEKETGLHKTTIFKKINQGRKMSLLIIENKTYRMNEKIWREAIDFLIELKKYEKFIDQRVPGNSIIYYKNNKEIVFSNKEKIDAVHTAFSAYEDYGIKILNITNYYYLPKRKVTRKEIFLHSLYVTEKEKDIRQIIFIALFYIKFKRALKNINHPIIENIKKILTGEEINKYPNLQEINDKADVYNIEV